MTAARRERKSPRLGGALAAILGVVAAAAGFGSVSTPINAATTELVVANRFTGLAIDGFDPVAYFVDDAPRIGRAELEFRFPSLWNRQVAPANRNSNSARPILGASSTK